MSGWFSQPHSSSIWTTLQRFIQVACWSWTLGLYMRYSGKRSCKSSILRLLMGRVLLLVMIYHANIQLCETNLGYLLVLCSWLKTCISITQGKKNRKRPKYETRTFLKVKGIYCHWKSSCCLARLSNAKPEINNKRRAYC